MSKSADLCLQADESPRAVILGGFDGLLQDAVRCLEQPSDDRAKDIHAARTTIKHVRAILRLIRPVIGDRAFRRENTRLKKAAQFLAPMREATVGIQTLHRLAHNAEGKRTRRDFSAAEARATERAGTAPPANQEKAVQAAVRVLESSRPRLRTLRFASGGREVIERGLEKVYRTCRKRMKHAFATGDDEGFHRWRMRLKNLYYELQLLVPVWPKRLQRMVNRLREVQEQIGADHDLTVLKAALQKTPQHFGDGPALKRMLRQLKTRSETLRRDCQPLAEKIFAEKPRKFMRRFDRHWKKWRGCTSQSRAV